MLVKPRWLLDRDLEWAALARFVESNGSTRTAKSPSRQPGPLAIMYGPRRAGKSFVLEALCETDAQKMDGVIGIEPSTIYPMRSSKARRR